MKRKIFKLSSKNQRYITSLEKAYSTNQILAKDFVSLSFDTYMESRFPREVALRKISILYVKLISTRWKILLSTLKKSEIEKIQKFRYDYFQGEESQTIIDNLLYFFMALNWSSKKALEIVEELILSWNIKKDYRGFQTSVYITKGVI